MNEDVLVAKITDANEDALVAKITEVHEDDAFFGAGFEGKIVELVEFTVKGEDWCFLSCKIDGEVFYFYKARFECV